MLPDAGGKRGGSGIDSCPAPTVCKRHISICGLLLRWLWAWRWHYMETDSQYSGQTQRMSVCLGVFDEMTL